MSSVYLSHSNAERDFGFAQRLAGDLKRAGVGVWFEEFEPGHQITASMRKGIEDMGHFAIVLSPNSVQPSCGVHYELELALKKQLRQKTVGKILPLLIENCALPESVKDTSYIDFRDLTHYQEGLNRLLQALGVETGESAKPMEPRHGVNGTPEDGLSAQAYALIALVGLAIGIGLLLFYVYQVPTLVENGAQNQVFYLLLIPWALACAAFLFGAMRSYARFTHQHLGNALELGGPVVLFCLVLAGGFKLVPQPSESFDLTVRPHSADGANPIITSGKITLDLDNDRRTETINPNGEVNFKGIRARFKGTTIKILPQVDSYKQEWQRHKLAGDVLDLPLERATQPVNHLSGSIVPPPANWKVLRLVVDGQPGEGKVDELGRFELLVNGKDGDRIRLKIHADGDLVYDDYQSLPGPVTIKLHRSRR